MKAETGFASKKVYPESFKEEVSSLGEDFRGRHVIGDVEVVSR